MSGKQTLSNQRELEGQEQTVGAMIDHGSRRDQIEKCASAFFPLPLLVQVDVGNIVDLPSSWNCTQFLLQS